MRHLDPILIRVPTPSQLPCTVHCPYLVIKRPDAPDVKNQAKQDPGILTDVRDRIQTGLVTTKLAGPVLGPKCWVGVFGHAV